MLPELKSNFHMLPSLSPPYTAMMLRAPSNTGVIPPRPFRALAGAAATDARLDRLDQRAVEGVEHEQRRLRD